MVEVKFLELIAREVSSTPPRVAAVIELLDGGATIPFIAKYRKDAVGNLNETKLETIQECRNQIIGVIGRRKAILEALAKQGKLTDELRAKIEACSDKASLEDAFLPFKSKRGAKAMIAEEHGLAPLADFIMMQLPGLQSVDEFAEAFVKSERSVSSVEEALEGARHVLAERFTIEPEARALMRDFMLNEGVLTSRGTKNATGTKTRYEALYNLSEPFSNVAPARVLAIMRGLKEGFLRVDIAIDEVRMFNILLDRYLKDPNSIFGPHIRLALNEAYARHLRPSVEKEVLELVKKRANDEVILSCCETARNLLLAAPAGHIAVIGVVPESKIACDLGVVDAAGTFVESAKAAFAAVAAAPEGQEQEIAPSADEVISDLIQRHGVRAIVVGTGTGARDVARAINELLGRMKIRGVHVVMMTAGPASAYAASRQAREEFPDLDTPVREAVSLARRLQDPLSELVKVEPRAMGLGQQQYDVNQKQLRDALFSTLVSCVSRVGADLNRAPVDLLRYISGLQMGTAQKLVEKRQEINGFKSRAQMMEVDGIGPKVFEQCAGFLRVIGGDNPLDATAIHPELYGVVERVAQGVGVPVSDLIGSEENIAKVDAAVFEGDGLGPLTLADMRRALLEPGHDPRGTYRPSRFREGVARIETLQEGTETEGVVTSVADFGAFVDVGVQHDGLVHLSEISNRFVKDPREVIKVGDVVKVKVTKIDKDKDPPRISLSIKALQPRPVRRRPAPEPAAEARPGVSRGATQPEEPTGAQRPRRAEPGRRGRDERGETSRPRPARADRSDRDRERGRDRERAPRDGDRSSRPSRNTTRPREDKRVQNFGDAGGQLNTQLADQLAALRDKIKS